MKISKLELTNFRNHKKLSLEFNENITLIKGQNGAGKTNILEAIYIISCAKSPKARFDRDTINHGENYCTVKGFIETKSGEEEIEVQIIKNPDFENASTKKIKVNKVAKSQKNLSELFFTVLFSPEDISVISGSPGDRRKYIDMVLFQIDYTYKKNTIEYAKAIKRRNKILEQIRELGKGEDQLDFWTNMVLLYGSKITERRKSLLEFISNEVNANSDRQNGFQVNYLPSIASENRFYEYKNKEIAAKTTLIGPHRDDFEIKSKGYNINEFGSRGQQRSAILDIKLAEIEFVKKETGERPVLLLDDIFSELDQKHRSEVLELIHKQQTIITTAEELEFTKDLAAINL